MTPKWIIDRSLSIEFALIIALGTDYVPFQSRHLVGNVLCPRRNVALLVLVRLVQANICLITHFLNGLLSQGVSRLNQNSTPSCPKLEISEQVSRIPISSLLTAFSTIEPTSKTSVNQNRSLTHSPTDLRTPDRPMMMVEKLAATFWRFPMLGVVRAQPGWTILMVWPTVWVWMFLPLRPTLIIRMGQQQ